MFRCKICRRTYNERSDTPFNFVGSAYRHYLSDFTQSSRGIKHRYYPTLGFGEFDAAQRFCQAVDEIGNFLRPRNPMGEFVCLSDRRPRFLQGVEELETLFHAA